MKKIRSFLLPVVVTGAVFISLTSFTGKKEIPAENASAKLEKVKGMINTYTADGSDLSYNELVNIGTTLKGGKLSVAEKTSLKMMRKKVSNALISNNQKAGGEKSQVIALILCILVGGIGIHRFYLGYTWQGVVQLLTGGGCGVWALIDLIRIITGDLKPNGGEYDKTL